MGPKGPFWMAHGSKGAFLDRKADESMGCSEVDESMGRSAVGVSASVQCAPHSMSRAHSRGWRGRSAPSCCARRQRACTATLRSRSR